MSLLAYLRQHVLSRFADHEHVIVIHPWRLAFFRVPKAANTTLKEAFAAALNLRKLEGLRVSQDRYWRAVAPETVEMITPRAFAVGHHSAGYWSFAVVRDPVARVVSCYKSKIVKPRRIAPAFAKRGFSKEMTFDAFVRRVHQLPDREVDDHLRSQASMLTWKGRLLPELVIPVEELPERWSTVCDRVRAVAGAELPPLARKYNVSDVRVAVEPSDESVRLIRQRYAEDCRLFHEARAGR